MHGGRSGYYLQVNYDNDEENDDDNDDDDDDDKSFLRNSIQ